MGRESHSHAERHHRQHSQHVIHCLEEKVKELERDCAVLLYERDHARDIACQLEEVIAEYRRIEPLRFSKSDVAMIPARWNDD